MKHCPICNRSFPDDAPPFCNEDGTRLVNDSPTPPPPAPPPVPPPAALATKHCPTCKRSFPADAPPFCNDDGARLVSDSPVSSPLVPPPIPPAPTLASLSALAPQPAQAPSPPAKKTMARRVLIIVVAVIAIILGVIQIMRGLHLISYSPQQDQAIYFLC